MDNEKEIIDGIIQKYNLDLGDDYFYVGASIVKRSEFPNCIEIFYCEDGLNDDEGNTYIMKSVIPKGVCNRDRIIVFYKKDLQRYIIPIDGENYTLIGNDIPENVKNINYGKAKIIIHRKALELKKEPEKLSKEDVDSLYKRYIKRYKKGRMLLAGILSSFLWIFIVFIGLAFLITGMSSIENISESFMCVILLVGIVIDILGAILIIRFFIKIPTRLLKGLEYKSDFLVLEIIKKGNVKGLNIIQLSGLVYDDGQYRVIVREVSHYDIDFIKDMQYYEIVNRYSKTKNPQYLEYCLFEKK
jgi:hypothetical protein